MISELLDAAILASVLAAAVRIATPILFAALGEMTAERGGVYNMGIEGTMLFGAFAAYLVTYKTGSQWTGVAAAMAAGGLMSLVFGLIVITLRVEQIVTGLAMNLLASGLTTFWLRAAFAGDKTPTIPFFDTVPLPYLSAIPILGPMLFDQKALTYIAFAAVPLLWFVLFRTQFGLALRCVGENPKALDTKGLSVAVRQYAAVVFGGVMAGLGGAFLSVGSAARFVPDMVNGRGWLAIVIVIAGGWRPWPILIACLLFSALDALQLQIQGIGIATPYQILLALPYICAILVLVLKRSKALAPAMLGVSYRRE